MMSLLFMSQASTGGHETTLFLVGPTSVRLWAAWHSSNRKKKHSVREYLTKLAFGKLFEASREALVIGSFKERKISDFVTSRTKDVFPALGVNDTFVRNLPSTWDSESHFNVGLTKVNVMAVMNDSVERGFAFIEKFNTALTTKEEQTQ